jgi:Yip1 domain
MIKALLLIFNPAATWDRIVRTHRGLATTLLIYLLPMLLLVSAGEGFGLATWGKWQGEVAHVKKFPPREAVVVEAAQVLLSLIEVFVGANMVKSLGETFRSRSTYTQAFIAVAYGLSPLFLFRLLDAFRWVSPWLSWSIGIILSIAVLYHGLPRLLDPDPAHAFGLFLMSALLLALVTGLARFVTAMYLVGRFEKLQGFVAYLAARLPF